jgi:thymidine kinase
MTKLYFKYGTMNSSKTANLLMLAHNYKSKGKKVFLIKPAIDNRFGNNTINSRAVKNMKADLLLEPEAVKKCAAINNKSHCINTRGNMQFCSWQENCKNFAKCCSGDKLCGASDQKTCENIGKSNCSWTSPPTC